MWVQTGPSKGQILGKEHAPTTHCCELCKMDEPIEMPFGL